MGNSLLDSGSYILNAIGRVDLSPAWVVDQLLTAVVDHISSHPIVWRPGAIELLESFAESGVPCALVSASYRVLLNAALSQLPEGTFQVSVAGDEVSRGKPHPEPYEKACTALGVAARHCVVLEDSETGCRAGNAAGALVVAIPHRVPIPHAPRRLQVRSLAELDAASLARAAGAVRWRLNLSGAPREQRKMRLARCVLAGVAVLLAGHRVPNARRPSGTHSDGERDPATVHGDVDRSDPGHRSCGDHRRGVDDARAQRVPAADDG